MQVSSPLLSRRQLAPTILRVRTIAYFALATFVFIAWLVADQMVVTAALALPVAAVLPFFDRRSAGEKRVEIAVAIDVVVAAVVWWRVPGDPVLSLVITLWAVAVGAFFCSDQLEKLLVGMIGAIEVAKLPIAASLAPERFGMNSFFRQAFESEWWVQTVLTIGRLGIVTATYILFRVISRAYRQSQSEIEESEIRFRTLVETSPNTILVAQNGDLVFANPAAHDLLDSEPGQLIGMHMRSVIPEDGQRMAADVIDSAQSQGTVHRLPNMRMVRPDGDERRVDLTLAPTVFQGEEAVQIVARDVTERYRAEQVLAASEERYRTFFELLPVALYRTAPDGRIIDANQETVRLLGVADKSDLVNRMASSFYIDPDDRTEFGQSIRRRGVVIGQEFEMRRASGDAIWVRDSARVVSTPDGDVYEGALIDVTDRRNAESLAHRRAVQQESIARIGQLALTGASLTEVFDAVAATMARELDAGVTGVLCTRGDGSFELEAGIGWSPGTYGELIARGKASHHQFVINSPEPVLINELTEEDRFQPSSYLLEQGVRTGASVKIPAAAGPLGLLGAFRTDVVPFTEDDVHFLETLANVVGAAIQRHRAAKRLEELVKSKDQFVATVSHEVRTPLTVVSGLAQELADRWEEFEPAEVQDLVELLVDQSREMAELVEDLLVSARADIGMVEIRPEPLDLGEHVSAVLEPLTDFESERIKFGSDEATALADPIRLRQIIRNLITNAIRYGGPHIWVNVGNGGPTSYLEVRDDGRAISQDDQERIFEPYHRAHEFTGRTGSVGLGLAVSRTLAEMMDGTLTYSHDGESVFRLTLPAS